MFGRSTGGSTWSVLIGYSQDHAPKGRSNGAAQYVDRRDPRGAQSGSGRCGQPTTDTTASGATPPATSTAVASSPDGFCSLISRATLEQAYGPMIIIRNDHGPISGTAVRGSCDYLKDESNDYRVFFTLNVNSDPDRQSFDSLRTRSNSVAVAMTGAEVYEVDAGLLDLVAHKNSTTIEVGLRVGPILANEARDKAVALELLREALSHF
jgi:hypothetical protein